jgi:predicted transposase YdaD
LPDQPYEVTIGDESEIVHVEAQTAYDPNLPERMLDYAVRLWLKYRLPVRSYVLLLTNRKLGDKIPANMASVSAGDLRVDLSYAPVRLWRLSAQEALELDRQNLLPFVPLMRGGERELETGVQRLAAVPDDKQREELSLHFLVLGGLRYNEEDLLDLMGESAMIPIDQLKESSFYQYILREGREEGLKKGLKTGLKKGLKKGREEGREEGRRDGAARILLRLMERRFGKLSRSARSKIEKADAATLEQWSVQVLEASSVEDALAKSSGT